MRAVTHFDVSRSECEEAVGIFASVLTGLNAMTAAAPSK
jgi:hypothetical protein